MSKRTEVCIYAERGYSVLESFDCPGASPAQRRYSIAGPQADPLARYETLAEAISALRGMLAPMPWHS